MYLRRNHKEQPALTNDRTPYWIGKVMDIIYEEKETVIPTYDRRQPYRPTRDK